MWKCMGYFVSRNLKSDIEGFFVALPDLIRAMKPGNYGESVDFSTIYLCMSMFCER